MFLVCIQINLIFLMAGVSDLWSLYLRMLGIGLRLKTTALLVFFFWLAIFFEKPVNVITKLLVDHQV